MQRRVATWAAVIVVTIALPSSSSGVTTTWSFGKRSFWDDAPRWSNGVPDVTKDAEIEGGRRSWVSMYPALIFGKSAKSLTLGGATDEGWLYLAPPARMPQATDEPPFVEQRQVATQLTLQDHLHVGFVKAGVIHVDRANLYCPVIEVGSSGNGQFFHDGGLVAKNANREKTRLTVGAGATGRYFMDFGTLIADTTVIGDSAGVFGLFAQKDGDVKFGDRLVVGKNGTGLYQMKNGFIAASNIYIADGTGTGTFEQTGGSTVVQFQVYIADPAPTDPPTPPPTAGKITISGAKTWFTVKDTVYIGEKGRLEVLKGGKLLSAKVIDNTKGGTLGPCDGSLGTKTSVRMGELSTLEVGDTSAPGTCEINEHYDQGGGTMKVDLGGKTVGTYDTLWVLGDAKLSGTLWVSLVNSFSPNVGDAFLIVTAKRIVGRFDELVVPDLGPTARFEASYTRDSAFLRVIAATPP